MRHLDEGNIPKTILYMSLPMLVVRVFQNIYNITDIFFVGKLGPTAIAAVSMSGIIIGFLMTLMIGISMGSFSVISRKFGERKINDVKISVVQSLYLSVAAYILSLTLIPFLGKIFTMLGAESDVVALSVRFMRIILLGSIFMFVSMMLNSTLRATGDPKTPTRILIISTILNVILDPILIYGLLGFPKLGVDGAAIATVVSRFVASMMVIKVYFFDEHALSLKLADLKPDIDMMKKIIGVGIFVSASMLLRNISSMILMRIVSVFGTVAIAAYGVGMRISSLLVFPSFGIGRATASIVGQSFGSKKMKRALKTVYESIKIFSVPFIAISLLAVAFSRSIMGFFTKDPEVISIGATFLNYTFPFIIFTVISVIASSSMNSIGKPVKPTIITFIALILIQIPLALILRNYFSIIGVWMAIDVSVVFQGIFNFAVFVKTMKSYLASGTSRD